MPEPATHFGLIVIGRTSTILFLGQAADHLLPRVVGATVLSPDLEDAVREVLLRLSSTIPKTSDARARWTVVDLRTGMTSAND